MPKGKTSTKLCKICSKEVSLFAYNRHVKSHVSEKTTSDRTSCQYCQKEYTTPIALGNHEIRCKNNPNRKVQRMTEEGKERAIQKKIANGNLKHSEQAKQKISAARRKFLFENPNMVPYKLNHYSKRRSYAELYWSIVFETKNILATEEYNIGIYSLDFAIVDKKIDIEIDGEQHFVDKRVIESDNRRNAYLNNLGWTVIRVRWSKYNKLSRNEKEIFIDRLIKKIGV